MATVAPAPVRVSAEEKKRAEERLAKYRSMRGALDCSSRGDTEALKAESRLVRESLLEERARANSLLLKRK